MYNNLRLINVSPSAGTHSAFFKVFLDIPATTIPTFQVFQGYFNKSSLYGTLLKESSQRKLFELKKENLIHAVNATLGMAIFHPIGNKRCLMAVKTGRKTFSDLVPILLLIRKRLMAPLLSER